MGHRRRGGGKVRASHLTASRLGFESQSPHKGASSPRDPDKTTKPTRPPGCEERTRPTTSYGDDGPDPALPYAWFSSCGPSSPGPGFDPIVAISLEKLIVTCRPKTGSTTAPAAAPPAAAWPGFGTEVVPRVGQRHGSNQRPHHARGEYVSEASQLDFDRGMVDKKCISKLFVSGHPLAARRSCSEPGHEAKSAFSPTLMPLFFVQRRPGSTLP